jgi:2-dehydro-3-deoxygluconokinase
VIACVGEPLICFSSPSLLDTRVADIGEAGAEFNVAVHLARFGLGVRFVGAVGDDVLGQRIEARLRREGVDVSALHREPGGRTGAYVKDTANRDVVYFRAGSAASRFTPPPHAFDGVRHVHLTGIGAALSDACADALDHLLDRPRTYTVSFDVNHRAKLWDADDAALCLARLTGKADLVFVGRDEAELLWGTTTADEIRTLLGHPAELVVKDDDRAAVAWLGADRVALAPEQVAIVEPVGAGDAFAAGYLYGRGQGHGPLAALAAGHRLARAALTASDDLGDPVPRDELDRLLEGVR